VQFNPNPMLAPGMGSNAAPQAVAKPKAATGKYAKFKVN
jgi:hypothetical protein